MKWRREQVVRILPVLIAFALSGIILGTDTVLGQAAGAFSRIGFGARGIAMGNALAADVTGSASPYYNPALAPFISDNNLEASVALLSFDRSLQYLQISSPLQGTAGVAIGLIHAGVTGIDGRDNSGFHTDNLTVDEYAGFLAFGIQLSGRVSAGVGFQFFRSDLFDGLKPVNSIGIDIGLSIRIAPKTYLGLVADDLLARFTWDTSGINGSGGKSTTDNFPRRLRLGVMQMLKNDRLRILAEVESRVTSVETVTRRVQFLGSQILSFSERKDLSLQETRVRIGAEYALHPVLVVRGGLEQLDKNVLGGVRPSAGFMVEQSSGTLRARFEYTFALESRASGTMHLLSIQLFL